MDWLVLPTGPRAQILNGMLEPNATPRMARKSQISSHNQQRILDYSFATRFPFENVFPGKAQLPTQNYR
jgi:hypothetical protein